METMDEANRADMKAERLMKDAMRAIDAVLQNGRRLTGTKLAHDLTHTRDRLSEAAAQIVRSWD